MSDEINNNNSKQPLGMLADPAGDISSGRVMKMQAFWIAMSLSVVGLIAIITLGCLGKADVAKEATSYLITVVGMYLGVATGAELVQKLTGK